MGLTKRIMTPAPASWTQWSFLASLPPTDSTPTYNVDNIIIPPFIRGATANSEAQGVSLDFDLGFDDSAFDVNIWLLNNPGLSGHVWKAAISAGSNFPLTISSDIGGIAFPSNPLTKPWDGSLMYDPLTKRIREIIFQLQTNSALAEVFAPREGTAGMPKIMVDIQRWNPAVSRTRSDIYPLDIDRGHFFTFSDVVLYLIDENDCWQEIAEIREDSFDIADTFTSVTWKKGKPQVPYMSAISEIDGTLKFQIAATSQRFEALSKNTVPMYNAYNKTLDISVFGKKRPIMENSYALRWLTEGGFLNTLFIPRGNLSSTGNKQPGATGNFAEQEFTITCLADGCKREIMRYMTSEVPVQTMCALEIGYEVTAV